MGMIYYSNKPLSANEYVLVAKNHYALRDEWKQMSMQSRHFDICTIDASRHKLLMFTGQSACAIYNIPRLDKYEMRSNCISEKNRSSSEMIRWHYGSLDPDAKIINGLLVASPVRTVLDLAKNDSPKSLLVSINHCLYNHLFTLEDFEFAIENRPGMKKRKLLKTLTKYVNEKCQSPLETIALVELHNSGFVIPQQQITFFDKHEFVACVDMFWELRNRRIVLELDGKNKYTDDEVLYKEKLREDRLRRLGLEVMRAGWVDVNDGTFVQMLKDNNIPIRRYRSIKIPR